MFGLKLLFENMFRTIDPISAIGIGSAGLGALSSLIGGGGRSNIDDLLKMLRKNTVQTSGASGKLDEAILGQNLAGTSRLQKQNVLGQQQNRQLEALFNQLSQTERQALALLLQAQGQQDRLRFARNQSLFANIGQIAQNLPELLGKPRSTGGNSQNDIIKLILGNISNPNTAGTV